MNILYTLPDLHFGGTSNLLYQNIKGLSKTQTVHVVYFGPNDLMFSNFSGQGIKPHRIPYNGFKDIVKTIILLRKFLKQNEIDIIHCNLFLDKLLVSLATVKIKKIGVIHSADDNQSDIYIKNKIIKRIETFINKNFMHRIIAVSYAAKQFSVEKLGIPSKKIEVIYNGIQSLDNTNTNYSYKPDEILIGTACRFHSIKGIPRLISVFKELRSKGLNVKLILIGDGGQRTQIEQKIKDLGLCECIEITGFTNDVTKYVSQLDYYINSSYSEAMPISVLEALSLGKPVIASKVGGLLEIIEDEKNGTLVDFNEIPKAALEIEQFIRKSESEYNILSLNSKLCFNKNFSSERYVSNLNLLYESMFE